MNRQVNSSLQHKTQIRNLHIETLSHSSPTGATRGPPDDGRMDQSDLVQTARLCGTTEALTLMSVLGTEKRFPGSPFVWVPALTFSERRQGCLGRAAGTDQLFYPLTLWRSLSGGRGSKASWGVLATRSPRYLHAESAEVPQTSQLLTSDVNTMRRRKMQRKPLRCCSDVFCCRRTVHLDTAIRKPISPPRT